MVRSSYDSNTHYELSEVCRRQMWMSHALPIFNCLKFDCRPAKWRIKLEQTSGTSTYSFTCIHYMEFNALIRHVLEGELSQRPKTLQGLGGGVDSCWHLEMHVSHMLNHDRCKKKGKSVRIRSICFILYFRRWWEWWAKKCKSTRYTFNSRLGSQKIWADPESRLIHLASPFPTGLFLPGPKQLHKGILFLFFYLVKTCNRLLEITICTLEQKNWNRMCITLKMT